MFGSNVLDIGIGLILTYLLLSLTVTAANELVANLCRSRARNLELGIRNILDGPNGDQPRWWESVRRAVKGVDGRPRGAWSEAFFRHQLIDALSKGAETPSYVPPQTFATVLMHLVRSPAAVTENAAPFAERRSAILTALAAAAPLPGSASFNDIRNAIQLITNPTIKSALFPLVEEARADLSPGISEMKRVSERIEKWYEQTMERVSGWYQRRTQWALFVIALIFTVVLNVDSVKITRCLAKNSTLRDSLVAKANQTASSSAPGKPGTVKPGTVKPGTVKPGTVKPGTVKPGTAKPGTAKPGTAKPGTAKPSPAKPEPAKPDVVADFKQVENAVGGLGDLGIPLGWTDPFNASKKLICTSRGWLIMATKLLGLLLTAFAASLGAPFWFDVLNKFMSVRSAGKAPEEKPKGPK